MLLPYDPGNLPTRPAPVAGEFISFEIDGWPPIKDVSFSIRNCRHPLHARFLGLRRAATAAMEGRAWYAGPVGLDLSIHGPAEERKYRLVDYTGGVMDTLDGCHGQTFTFLPICFEDDAQVSTGRSVFVTGQIIKYVVTVTFL